MEKQTTQRLSNSNRYVKFNASSPTENSRNSINGRPFYKLITEQNQKGQEAIDSLTEDSIQQMLSQSSKCNKIESASSSSKSSFRFAKVKIVEFDEGSDTQSKKLST